MRIIICILLFVKPIASCFSQIVTDVSSKQLVEQVEVVFTLKKTADVRLVISTDSGSTWNDMNVIYCKGDFGKKIPPGQKKIIYEFQKDKERTLTPKDIFKVIAVHSSTKKVNGLSFDIVLVEGGTFEMGSPKKERYRSSDEVQHDVTLNSFYICKKEVAHFQYIQFLNNVGVNENGSLNGIEFVDMDDGECAISYQNNRFVFKNTYLIVDENYPLIEVTWAGAKAFAEWVGGRLPTEAEWEYAAKGGAFSNGFTFAGGNKTREVAIYKGTSKRKLQSGSRLKPNELGLFDMSGSVWEWCNDWYAPYNHSENLNPQGTATGEFKVLRGGSWNNYAEDCRSAYRGSRNPRISGLDCGFRVVFDHVRK